MSLRLDPEEAWAVIAAAPTGIVTTLRADGLPISLPVWFAVVDGAVCFGAPTATRKVARIRRDPRAAFLVESGTTWADLAGVHLTGRVAVVDDPAAVARIADAIDAKYHGRMADIAALPPPVRAHYEQRTTFRLDADERILSWDNRRLPAAGGATP